MSEFNQAGFFNLLLKFFTVSLYVILLLYVPTFCTLWFNMSSLNLVGYSKPSNPLLQVLSY